MIGGDMPGAGNLISGNGVIGLLIIDSGTSNNQVLGNYIGTDVSGQMAISNGATADGSAGVGIYQGATDNVIGGTTLDAGNLISGQMGGGIEIALEDTNRNVILGNYIGTDATGTRALGNGVMGILIAQGAKDNVVGGDQAGARNLISGNRGAGVQIQGNDASETTGNQVLGNYIGTDITGTSPLSNTIGVGIAFGATHNVIGGDRAGARNLISGNGGPGIQIQKSGTISNQVIGNYIGTVVTGTLPLGNGGNGLAITEGASHNTIGGEMAGAGNLISGNGEAGVYLEGKGTTANQIAGNYIGTDAFAEGEIPNAAAGIHLRDGANANIGISNTIAYNAEAGVLIEGDTASGNTITRDLIYQNGGLPIDWIDTTSHPAPPTLTSYSSEGDVVLGSTCGNCRVEIFAGSNENLPEGRVFLAAVTVDASGNFTLTLHSPPPLRYLSATATDPDGNTSEFSSTLDTVPPTATPTVTATATPTSTPTVTATATPTATAPATPTAGTTTPTATATATPLAGPTTPTVTATATPPSTAIAMPTADPTTRSIYLPLVINGD
jgi:titin